MKTNYKAILAGIFGLIVPVAGLATEVRTYSAPEFHRAMEGGKTIVLAFHKEGCSTCAAQEPALESVLQNQSEEKVKAFRVKFDPSSDLAKEYGVVRQSTLVVLRGADLRAKEVGITGENEILTMIKKGI